MVATPVGRDFLAAFARRELEGLAGPRSFPRGLDYAREGKVVSWEATDREVRGQVEGERRYDVALWVEADHAPLLSCTCPFAAEGAFCKHGVALALVATGAVTPPEPGPAPDTDLRAYLLTWDRSALVDLVLERAAVDEFLAARLRVAAAGESPQSLTALRRAIDDAFETHGFVHYREVHDYTRGLHDVVTTLQKLLDDGHAIEVAELALYALDRVNDAAGHVDDSDGTLGGIVTDLADLHLDACLAMPPDPIDLARMLVDRELHDGDLEAFYGAAGAYADVLGADGLAEYRCQVEALWEGLPPRTAGAPFDHRYWRISRMMESLALADGDLDAVIAVLTHDLTGSYRYVDIVQRLRDAERHPDALTWAEKGLDAFGTADDRLVDATIAQYEIAGRDTDATDLGWRAFDERPAVQAYLRLHRCAERTGDWTARRDQAHTRLRAQIAAAPPSTRWQVHDGSLLVQILLLDEEPEAAWAVAQAHGCSRALWRRLAEIREGTHPREAIPIWQREIENAIAAKSNDGYADAVVMIARVGALLTAAGAEEEFVPYIEAVRRAHKPKRNLMKLFAQRGW